MDLLISTVHRIFAQAGKKVNTELVNAFKRAGGQENVLFHVAEASLADPPAVVVSGDTQQEVTYSILTGTPTTQTQPALWPAASGRST